MASSCQKILTTTKYDVYLSNATIVCIAMGVLLTLIAFFYPVEWDYTLDQTQSAKANEERRAHQVRVQTMVYVMSLIGIVLVTIGGIVSSFLMTKYILLDECVQTDDDIHTTAQGSPPPTTANSHVDSKSTGKTSKTVEGPKSILVNSDHLQFNGACQQYGSTK